MKGKLIAVLYFLIIPLATVKAIALVVAPKTNDIMGTAGLENMVVRVLFCIMVLLMAANMFFDGLHHWRGPKKPTVR